MEGGLGTLDKPGKILYCPWKCCFPWWFLQIQVGQINLCSPIKLLCEDIDDKRLMDLYTCNIGPRENVDENNKMYLFWTSTDGRIY